MKDATGRSKRNRKTLRSTLDGDWIILIERDKLGDAPSEEQRVSITRKELQELDEKYIATPLAVRTWLRGSTN
jgi:hypothetical protein